MLPIISVLTLALFVMLAAVLVVGLAAWWSEEFPRE